MPDVSILIPTYNRRHMVHEAIASALAVRAFGIRAEVIVVDDCSTDGTFDELSRYEPASVRAVRLEKNQGQNVARNTALALATGEYVKFLDSDDLLVAEHLTAEIRAARAAQADAVVSGFVVTSTADGSTVEVHEAPDMDPMPDSLLAGRAVPTSAALYKRSMVDDLRWDPELRNLDDWDWFCRAVLRATKIIRVPGIAYAMREHPGARVTSNMKMIHTARAHHRILGKIERILDERDQLTEPRRKRLAQYYYKELRVLALNDRAGFEEAAAHIDALDPRFIPVDEERQRWMRVAARLLGYRRAILLHCKVKRLLKRDQSPAVA